MGGRGASSGISSKGKKYGTEYTTLFESGNIKFVTNVAKNHEPLMETMTEGRVYVQVGGEDIVRIVLFGENNGRNKVIEKDKRTGEWHVHQGYFHAENSERNHESLNAEDAKFLEKVSQIWHNRKR